MKICKIVGCSNKMFCREVCNKHYSRFQKYGDFDAKFKPGNLPKDPLNNIQDKIIKNYNSVGCWKWNGATKTGGYGVITISVPVRKNERAYRYIYERTKGPVSEGLELDHFMYPQDGCIGPACCNPDHLKPVTHKENSLRSSSPMAINKAKTHCNRGHEYTEENTYRRPSRPEERECKMCINLKRKGLI